MKIGIYEKAINKKFSWEEKIKIAKDAGFNFIEISIDETDDKIARLDWSDKEINELKSLLDKHGMYFNSMCLSGHRKYPFGSADANTRKKAMEIMYKAIDFAKKFNIAVIQLAGYDVYYEESTEESKKHFVEGLKEAVRYAHERCIMLAFEVMDTPFMGTIERAVTYVNIINSPWLKVYPDVGNLSQFSKDPCKEIKDNKQHIVAYHLKETKPNTFRDLDFGTGDVKFVDILKAIKETDYNGPFLLEMWSQNKPDESAADNTKKIKEAREFILDKFQSAGWKNV